MSGELTTTPDAHGCLAVAVPADEDDALEIVEFAHEHRLGLQATAPDDSSSGLTMTHRKLSGMSEREREVMALLTRGCSNAAIGKHLFLSVKTVEKHVNSIYLKLGLDSGTDVHRRVLARFSFSGRAKHLRRSAPSAGLAIRHK